MPAISIGVVFLVAAALSGQAQEANKSRRFGPDACGPVDPSYIRLANETGGQPMFLQPSEIAQSGHFMRESSGQNHVTLVWANARLRGATREFNIPVDSTIPRLTFAASYDTKGINVSVIRPSGSEVHRDDSGVEDTALNCSRTVTITNPESGVWRVRISGQGTFWLQAMGRSDIYFVSARFVRAGGRPGHEGMFRIPGQPLAGNPAMLEVHFSGELEREALKLVSEDGNLIKPLEITWRDSSDSTSHEYISKVDLPETPFRIAMAGTDAKGMAFERYYSPLFHAESVEIEQSDKHETAGPGETTPLTFIVRNAGPAAAFRIVAADGFRFVNKVEPQELFLASGESKTITVEVTVPTGTPEGRGVDVSVIASSTAPRATSNSTVVHLSVSKSR